MTMKVKRRDVFGCRDEFEKKGDVIGRLEACACISDSLPGIIVEYNHVYDF